MINFRELWLGRFTGERLQPMPYLIDGHNLIPKLPGLSLETVDDEMQLVELLLAFCRKSRKRAEVFFDKSPVGYPRSRNFGLVVARYVREGQTADEAIRKVLARLGRQARNWTVVSSDQEVQTSARSARAHFVSAESFAEEMILALQDIVLEPGKRAETSLSEEEVDRWLELFNSDPEE